MHKLVILLASDALLLQTQVQVVLEQLLVVCATIEHDG